jgi:copper ion binding protein
MARTKIELKVEGMTCDGCVRSVERKLTKVAGVESARVDLGAGKAIVEYDDAQAQADQFISAVQQIGYRASRT